MALRSVTECAAVVDILHRDVSLGRDEYEEARNLLHRLVGMPTRLVQSAAERA